VIKDVAQSVVEDLVFWERVIEAFETTSCGVKVPSYYIQMVDL
jgi:hypothetical protein